MSTSEAWTFTFGESVENHAGMERLGDVAPRGFSAVVLADACERARKCGFHAEIFSLTAGMPADLRASLSVEDVASAAVLVIRNGAQLLTGDLDAFVVETLATREFVDKKAIMRGRLLNKLARWNLCYADGSAAPDLENGRGTVLAFEDSPNLANARLMLSTILGSSAERLLAELNYYYDTAKCGIGYHGDTERRKVVGLRVGPSAGSMPLHFQWFIRSKPVGENIVIPLGHGDAYVMGEKAVGTDWRRPSIATLRHATGCAKFTTVPEK